MIRNLMLLSIALLLPALGGCVIYDPGYYGPRYHYYHEGPPGHFRHFHDRGLNEEHNSLDPVFMVEYWDDPLMCVDPTYGEASGG